MIVYLLGTYGDMMGGSSNSYNFYTTNEEEAKVWKENGKSWTFYTKAVVDNVESIQLGEYRMASSFLLSSEK